MAVKFKTALCFHFPLNQMALFVFRLRQIKTVRNNAVHLKVLFHVPRSGGYMMYVVKSLLRKSQAFAGT